MTTPSIDSKHIVNMAYHAGIISVLTVGFSQITKKVFKMQTPKVDFSINDIGMLTVDILAAMYTRDMLVKQGILPADIMK